MRRGDGATEEVEKDENLAGRRKPRRAGRDAGIFQAQLFEAASDFKIVHRRGIAGRRGPRTAVIDGRPRQLPAEAAVAQLGQKQVGRGRRGQHLQPVTLVHGGDGTAMGGRGRKRRFIARAAATGGTFTGGPFGNGHGGVHGSSEFGNGEQAGPGAVFVIQIELDLGCSLDFGV